MNLRVFNILLLVFFLSKSLITYAEEKKPEFGQDRELLKKTYGTPEFQGSRKMLDGKYGPLDQYYSSGFRLGYDKENKLNEISLITTNEVKNQKIETVYNVSIKDTKESMNKKFGKPNINALPEHGYDVYTWQKDGLVYEVEFWVKDHFESAWGKVKKDTIKEITIIKTSLETRKI